MLNLLWENVKKEKNEVFLLNAHELLCSQVHDTMSNAQA